MKMPRINVEGKLYDVTNISLIKGLKGEVEYSSVSFKDDYGNFRTAFHDKYNNFKKGYSGHGYYNADLNKDVIWRDE